MRRKLFKIFDLILILILFSGCGIVKKNDNKVGYKEDNKTADKNDNSSEEQNDDRAEDNSIILKGAFTLLPSEIIDMEKEGFDPEQEYFLIIYDVYNKSDKNEELSGHADSIVLKFNNTNSYEQVLETEGVALQDFLDNCGYALSTDFVTLWGGKEEPIRRIAAFAINSNDIKEDSTATIQFDLSDNIKQDIDIQTSDIQQINLFDEVFSVENKPDEYQIARSIETRTYAATDYIQVAIQKYNQTNQRDYFPIVGTTISQLFSSDAEKGVSVGHDSSGVVIFSDQLKPYDTEAVREIYPDIADTVDNLSKNIMTLANMFNDDNSNIDEMNTIVHSITADANTVVDYFDKMKE